MICTAQRVLPTQWKQILTVIPTLAKINCPAALTDYRLVATDTIATLTETWGQRWTWPPSVCIQTSKWTMRHCALVHLEEFDAYVRAVFIFQVLSKPSSSTYSDKLTEMGVDSSSFPRLQTTWQKGHFIRSVTADFKYNCEPCHIQKSSDYAAIVVYIYI